MEDFPWTDEKILAKQYAELHNLDLAETEKKFEEARRKAKFEMDIRSHPQFDHPDFDPDNPDGIIYRNSD